MKIGLFTDTYYPEINGVANSCMILHKELTRRGHEVHVFAPKSRLEGGGTEDPTVHLLPSKPFLLLRDRNAAIITRKTIQSVRDLHLDVVHTNSEFAMGMFGIHSAHRNSTILVHTCHTIWEDYVGPYVTHGFCDGIGRAVTRKMVRDYCRRVDRIIVPTQKIRGMLDRYRVTVPNEIIPTGMELDRYAPERHSEEQRRMIREECGVQPGERVLLNIGRIAHEKNLEQVLRVFPELKKTNPEVRLVIVGEGPALRGLRHQARDLGVADSVTFTGPKPWDSIDQYYAIGDVFVSCSHSETQGLTYIEAMAAGLCVCAVDDPCLNGVITGGETGILSGDSDEALLRSLRESFSPLGREIAARAPQAARPYSSSVFAERVEAFYLRAQAEKGNHK